MTENGIVCGSTAAENKFQDFCEVRVRLRAHLRADEPGLRMGPEGTRRLPRRGPGKKLGALRRVRRTLQRFELQR